MKINHPLRYSLSHKLQPHKTTHGHEFLFNRTHSGEDVEIVPHAA